MKHFYLKAILVTLLFSFCNVGIAKEHTVASADELHSQMKHFKPGDVVNLKTGRWHNQQIKIKAYGSPDNPIIFKAQIAGKTILTGNSYIDVKGAHITLQGLKFTDGYLDHKGHVVRLRGSNNRLTDTAILNYNPPSIKSRYFWVSLQGKNHRVDHNVFSGQNHSGVTAVVWLKEEGDGHHYIGYNYFGQRAQGDGNGFETIRIGTGKSSSINAHTLVEHNVFEECDGEMEIISNKSNMNTYRFNTFIKSAGTLTIRQGKHVVVANNFFLGGGKKRTGGVRVIGSKHLIYGNHFEELQGRAEGVISVSTGTVLKQGERHTLYPAVENIVIAANVLHNNTETNVFLNAGLGKKKRKILPQHLWFDGNVFHNKASNSPLVGGLPNDNFTWVNNAAHGDNLGVIKTEDFTKSGANKFSDSFTLAQAKASIEYSKQNCESIVKSLGKQYSQSEFSALCKKIGNKVTSVNNIPKTKNDVGISW